MNAPKLQFNVQDHRAIHLENDAAWMEDLNTLTHFRFVVPIRFQVGDTDLVGSSESKSSLEAGWILAPLIYIALSLPDVIDELMLQGYSDLDPYEYGANAITFVRESNGVVIRSDITGAKVFTELPILAAEVKTFVESTKTYLSHIFPELLNHIEVGPWLRGEVSSPFDI